ncbi:MAG TPA: hypothetical protein VGJ92_13065 [Methanocella sp.]|jgi:hypothetical protein
MSVDNSGNRKKLFLLLASIAAIAVIFLLILFIGALSNSGKNGTDNADVSPLPTPYSERVSGGIYPAITVIDNVTRVSLARAADTIMAAAEAINWTRNNPGWSLLSAHTESGDSGGRSQYWEFVYTSDTSIMIATVQEGNVVYTDVSYTSSGQPAEVPDNSTPAEYSQVTGESGNGNVVTANRNPVDSTVVMSAVLNVNKMDMSPYNTNYIIDYDGSDRIFTVRYTDLANPAKSFLATVNGDTGNLISNKK